MAKLQISRLVGIQDFINPGFLQAWLTPDLIVFTKRNVKNQTSTTSQYSAKNYDFDPAALV